MPVRQGARGASVPAPVFAFVVVLVALLAAACGSRLPESDFEARGGARDARTDGTGTGGASAAPLKVGIITSATSPVGGDAFAGPRDGAKAYFDRLNARGGIHGRRVSVATCDDGGSGAGNSECVRRLLGKEKVLALVAGASLDYAGARQVAEAGVPDIGGQPIGPAYDTYPHLYGIYGSLAPRRGGELGWDGRLYGGTEVYRYFKREHGARKAAVVSYNQSASAAYARLVTRGLKAEGYEVVPQQVDFALPNFRAVAAELRAQGVDLVFDAMDTHGNARLCEALDAAGVRLTAKVTNVQNWSSSVADDYADAPRCRNALWATSSSRNYADADHPAVRDFRRAMERTGPGREGLSQWQLEGWAAAMWFSDAAASCREPTRACVERFMQRDTPYTARGLLLPVRYERRAEPPRERRTCLSVARWRDGRGWVTQGPGMERTCFTVPQLGYRP
ncbi:ABC transporter substrate-binding protein [Streptomyces daliensis]|uniref:ABC transporter substrate-binding protein n=1 Tax=Streptomyces daliensis TaxID=299421 RepID=A0A8T4IHN2_9ACTN|nr:ABC transporter substrate-binding protein [Streptomyces daliensis]